MATKLYLKKSTNNGIVNGSIIYYDMDVCAGNSGGDTNEVFDTVASGTEVQVATILGDLIQWVSGPVPSGGFTLTTTDISIWAKESAMSVNAGGRYRIFKRESDGTETEVGGGPFDDGAEFNSNSINNMTWAGDVTDTAFAEGDRILLKIYATNIGTMAAGTVDFNFGGTTYPAYLNIAETVDFLGNQFNKVGTLGATGSATANQTTLAHTLTGSVTAGNLLVATIACDSYDLAGTDVSPRAISINDTTGNRWFFCHSVNAGNTTTDQDHANCAVWACIAKSAMSTSDVVTVTWRPDATSLIDATAISIYQFSIPSGKAVIIKDRFNSVVTGIDPTSIFTSTLSTSEGIWFRGIAAETNSATALTTTEGFTAITGAQGDSGTADTSMAVRGEFGIAGWAAFSDPTFIAIDNVSCAVVFSLIDENLFTDLLDGTLGTASAALTNTSLTLSINSNILAGWLSVVVIAIDNINSSDGDNSSITSVTDSQGNTWTKALEWENAQGGAGAGATCALWYTQATKVNGTVDSITANFSSNDNQAIISRMFQIPIGYEVSVEATNSVSDDGIDPSSLDATTSNINCLRIRGIASETASTSFTATGGFTSFGTPPNAGAMAAAAEFTFSTGTSDASDPTFVAADHASVYVAFKLTKITGVVTVNQRILIIPQAINRSRYW